MDHRRDKHKENRKNVGTDLKEPVILGMMNVGGVIIWLRRII